MSKNNKKVQCLTDIIMEENKKNKYANMTSIEKLTLLLKEILEYNKNLVTEDESLRESVESTKSVIRLLLETIKNGKIPADKYKSDYTIFIFLDILFDKARKLFDGKDIFNIISYLSNLVCESLKKFNNSTFALEYSKLFPELLDIEDNSESKNSDEKREEYIKTHEDIMASMLSYERFASINIKDLKQEDIDIASPCLKNFGFKYDSYIRMIVYLKNEYDKKNNVYGSFKIFDELVNYIEIKLYETEEILKISTFLSEKDPEKIKMENFLADLLELAEYLHAIRNNSVNSCYINFQLLSAYFVSSKVKSKDIINILKYFTSNNMIILRNDDYPAFLINDEKIPKKAKEDLINNFKSRKQYVLGNFSEDDLLTFEFMQEIMSEINLRELTDFDIQVYLQTLKNLKFSEEVIEKIEVYLHKHLNKQEEKSTIFLTPEKSEEKEDLNVKETTEIFLKLNKIIDIDKLELKVPLNSFAEIIDLGVLMKKARFKDEDIAKTIKSAYKRKEIEVIQLYSLYYPKLQNLAYQSINLKMEDINECINRIIISKSNKDYELYKEYINETLKEILEEVKEYQMYKGDLANYAFELNLIEEEMRGNKR